MAAVRNECVCVLLIEPGAGWSDLNSTLCTRPSPTNQANGVESPATQRSVLVERRVWHATLLGVKFINNICSSSTWRCLIASHRLHIVSVPIVSCPLTLRRQPFRYSLIFFEILRSMDTGSANLMQSPQWIHYGASAAQQPVSSRSNRNLLHSLFF